MFFHIQSTPSYKTCGADDPEKKKIMRSDFLSKKKCTMINVKICLGNH